MLLIGAITAASLSETRAPEKPRPPKEAPVAEVEEVPVQNTGPIMFVCADSPSHEDREVLITECSECGRASTFWQDNANGGFVCHACKKRYDDSRIKCPECGKTPLRVRIKIR